MLASNIPFVLFLLSTGRMMTTQATEPNCTDVADFENCEGDTAGFCPKGISCGCKDEMPFCKCPSYRVKWENYWYMGPKCDQLWSTLDLIIISSLPALALASVTIVSVQWICYCYNKPKKRPRKLGQVTAQAKHVPEYVTKSADEPRYVIPQNGVKNSRPAPNFQFPKISLQYQPDAEVHSSPSRGFSYIPSLPLRKVTSLSGNADGNQTPSVQPFSYWGGKIPAVDYEEENPFTNLAMQKLAI